MGEYYKWFNVDKCEQLEPGPFDTGAKIVSNVDVGNEYTDAVCTLLDSDWRGDRLVYLGDYKELDNEENPTLAKLEADCGHREPCALNEAEDIYADVAGRFSIARGKTYYDYASPGLVEVPYEGPMDKEIIHFRYVINDTKRQFYDRMRTPVTNIQRWKDGEVQDGINRLDLLAVFLGAGSEEWGDAYLSDGVTTLKPDGLWLNDVIRVSHDCPDADYEDLSNVYHIFYQPLITEPDEMLLPIVESQEFRNALVGDGEGDRIDHALRLIRWALDGVSLVGMDCLEKLLSRISSPDSSFVEYASEIAGYGGLTDALIVYLADGNRSAADVYDWLAEKLLVPYTTTPKGEKFFFPTARNARLIIRASDGDYMGSGRLKSYDSTRSYIGVWINDFDPEDIGRDRGEAAFLCSEVLNLLESDARVRGISRLFAHIGDGEHIAYDEEIYRQRGFSESSPDGERMAAVLKESILDYRIYEKAISG